jgi:hypothetical protein
MALDDAADVDDAEPARDQRGEPALDEGLEQAVLERVAGGGPRPVDAGRVRDHDLHRAAVGEDELLGLLLRALVGGALGVGGDLGLVEALALLGVEDVVGRGVDDPADAGRLRRCGEIAAPHRVDAVEDPIVREPLLRQPHRVEDELAALDRGAEGAGFGRVALHRLHAARKDRRGADRVADEDADVVAALGQGRRDRVSDLPGRPGDEHSHCAIVFAGL